MPSFFPTKKFFIVLAFLVLVSGSIFWYFRAAKPEPIENPPIEAVARRINVSTPEGIITPAMILADTSTTTMRALATVAYLKEQTKANGAEFEDIAASAGKEIQAAKKRLDADTYTEKDVKVIKDNSIEALKKYGKIEAGIFLYYGQGRQTSSYIEIIKEALEKNDTKKLAELDPFIDFYKKVLGASLAVSVPSSAVPVHLGIVNSYAETLTLLEGFRNLFGDLFPAVASQSRLDESSGRFVSAYTAANDFFKQQGVVFLPEESGNLFAEVANENDNPYDDMGL